MLVYYATMLKGWDRLLWMGSSLVFGQGATSRKFVLEFVILVFVFCRMSGVSRIDEVVFPSKQHKLIPH